MGGTVGDKLALSTGEDTDTTTADVNIGGKGGTDPTHSSDRR